VVRSRNQTCHSPHYANTERDYERDYQEALPQGRKAADGCKPRHGRDDRKRERSFSGLKRLGLGALSETAWAFAFSCSWARLVFLRNLEWPLRREPPVVTRRRTSPALSTYLMDVFVAKQAEGHCTALQQQQDLPRALRFFALHQDNKPSAVKWHIK
jgi:hypothetical protein